MKKIIISIMFCFIFISQNVVFSQYSEQWITQSISPQASRIKFLNSDVGYAGILNYSQNKSKILKTTNKGVDWNINVWEGEYDQYFTFDVVNENLINVYYNVKMRRTTDGGQNWFAPTNLINVVEYTALEQPIIKFFDASTGYLVYLNSDPGNYKKLFILKTNDGGQSWSVAYTKQGNVNAPYKFVLNDFSYISNNANHIIFVGYYYSIYNEGKNAFLTLETTNGFATYDYQSGSLGDYCSFYQSVNSLPGDPNQKRIILTKYNYPIIPNDPVNGMYCKTENSEYKINNDVTSGTPRANTSFSDNNKGYLYYADKIYKTDNSGTNWSLIKSELPSAGWGGLRINSFGDVIYALSSDGYFIKKRISTNIRTIDDIQNGFNGSMTVNNSTQNTPFSLFLNPGYNQFGAIEHLSSDEKTFYKWSDNSLKQNRNDNVINDNYSLDLHYKTKQKSTDETAIANVNQTKAIRGVNGGTYQIHSSIGGIFYTVSTSQNTDFGSEIVVNTNDDYAQLPNSNTADNNKNPSINAIKYFETDNSSLPAAYTMASAWERFDQNTNKTDILCALSMGTSTSPWIRFGNNLAALDGKITTLNNTTLSFSSKPDVYSMHISGATDDVRNYLMIVPHLEPSSNNFKLVTSVRYQNIDGFDYEALRLEDPDFETNDFKIVSDNVTDFSVTYKPVTYNSQKAVYLYFTYKKNGNIYYKRDLIYFLSNSNYSQIIREEIPVAERDFDLSTIDGQSQCNTPDITLRNGMPTISYQGKYDVNREVYYEGNINGPTVPLHYYPIFVKMRDVNGDWLSYYYNSNGFQTQENPDIEGSTDYDALVINYSKASSTFYQFVKINGLPGYNCTPGYFTGKDAKFVKGSYSGQDGTSTYPSLITLSNLSNSVHTVAMQPFTINNNQTSDGFSNLDGSIEIDNTTYSLTLGPIIASNTTYGFEDDTPPQTVQTPVEFNESMVSNEFPLSNNDTLILGAHGKYTSVGLQLQPLKYHVNLVNATTNQIHRELFRDTINVEDSVGIEFLRGFVINNIDKGTDQFYVQMIVDTVDAGDGDYMMAGVYSDNTPPEGDASHIYKTKVFFENGTTPALNNISNQIPKEFALSQNYPNPFNPSTTIKYSLPKDGLVTMKIYDMAGREVAKLVNEVKKAGYYQVQFNASNLASGVYFYRIQSNDFVMTKRMVLIK